MQVSREALSELERQLGEIPVRLQRLQKSGREDFAERSGQPVFAGARWIRAGLYRDAGGERGSFDRRAAGEPGGQPVMKRCCR